MKIKPFPPLPELQPDICDELFFLRTMTKAGFGITYHGDMVFSISVPKVLPDPEDN